MAPRFRPRLASHGPWTEKHAPARLQDVAINPQKVKEVVRALAAHRVVVLSGPPGSSKSTMLRLLARQQSLQIVEFTPPSSGLGFVGILNVFREFLLGVSFCDPATTLVLIDELPNVVHDSTREAFEEALLEYARLPAAPKAVVAFTEIEVSANYSDAIIVPRVLGQLVHAPGCAWVKANPISTRFLAKALDRVVASEGLALDATNRAELAACGDIRSALTALEFYAKIRAQAPDAATTVSSLLRTSTVNLFHAVGKIVYGSSEPASLVPAVEAFSGSLEAFNLTVLENYANAKHRQLPIEAASTCADWLSLGDMCAGLRATSSLGAAGTIALAEPDTTVTKQFRAMQYTQAPRWRSAEFERRAELVAFARGQRQHDRATIAACALDYAPFADLRARAPITAEPDFISSDDEM